MTVEANAPSNSEYIVHHLTHWQNKTQTEIVDFSVFNIDSIIFSAVLGVLAVERRSTIADVTVKDVISSCSRRARVTLISLLVATLGV